MGKNFCRFYPKEGPRLRVGLVQAWSFVAPCHPRCQKAGSPSPWLSSPHHDSATPAPLFSQWLNAACPAHLTALGLEIDEITSKTHPEKCLLVPDASRSGASACATSRPPYWGGSVAQSAGVPPSLPKRTGEGHRHPWTLVFSSPG